MKGKWSRETCYAVTSFTISQASHAQIAAIIRGHWGIEDRLYWAPSVLQGRSGRCIMWR